MCAGCHARTEGYARGRREWTGWEVGRLSGRGRFVAVTEDILGVGRWSVAVEDTRNERRTSVAVRGDGGFLVRQAGIAGGRQSTEGQAAQKDGHRQPLHDEESRHVPHALVVKDGLTANVPTATSTPVPAVTFFASDPEQSTILAVSIYEPLATLLLHAAPRACVVHGSQILPDVAQCESPLATFVSADDEQDPKYGVVRETDDLVPRWAW